jgi:hypothetical protein
MNAALWMQHVFMQVLAQEYITIGRITDLVLQIDLV